VKVVGKIRGTPAGSVTFSDGTTILGTALLRGGRARFTTSTLPIGRDAIRAVYSGEPNLMPSTSAVRIENIEADRSTTQLTSTPDPSRSGELIRLT
jgi:hypothetical protein